MDGVPNSETNVSTRDAGCWKGVRTARTPVLLMITLAFCLPCAGLAAGPSDRPQSGDVAHTGALGDSDGCARGYLHELDRLEMQARLSVSGWAVRRL